MFYEALFTKRSNYAGAALRDDIQQCEAVKVQLRERQSSSSSLATERCSDGADRDLANFQSCRVPPLTLPSSGRHGEPETPGCRRQGHVRQPSYSKSSKGGFV